MWDQGSEEWDLGSQPQDQAEHKPWDRNQQFLGGIRNQAVPFMWDPEPFFWFYNQGSEIWGQKRDQQ